MSELRTFLEALRDMSESTRMHNPGLRYQSYEAYILDQGREFPLPSRPRPVGVRKLANGACYSNALRRAEEHPEWQYVEGYASGVIPVQHAWCVDENGLVVETTWKDLGPEYFGVVIPLEQVYRSLVKTGYHGVISNDWMNDVSLLRYGEVRVKKARL